ncbi:nucleoside diphosphate kinase regulator [Prauserella sp. PE36]|uniref:Nucleoside diphosphate kinase regulator n=1 Tax=Prauserella endophytica TaxID=1592324 RepID=A0ABY2S8R5_9PSEU|nr:MULTISPECIES: GreA/GreB family elongation factor [Prauserella]PXY25992.1 nucleoside diphosphate kinase regulator [Prauserella coralliicola]RBM24108.1 nucleoside diphosphate kinase regulator [Prauserella sp. PE36]TKG71876.1 nucleoside diphosphate kinase regulator [Prauserella endophytica]
MTSTGGLSPATRARLEKELESLREQRESLAPRLGEDPLGDSADQADLLERAEVVSRLDRRIAEVYDLLHGGPTADSESALPSGTKVSLKFSDGSVEDMVVVGFTEEADEDDASTLTADSPLGRAITGHKKGDTITYRTPAGEVSAEILKLKLPA